MTESLFCDPSAPRARRDCLEHAGGCRTDLPPNCSKWRPGVTIASHVSGGDGAYRAQLADATYCLAFPGDGWSSRVLDAVVHGCVPVVVQDESHMFWGAHYLTSNCPLPNAF